MDPTELAKSFASTRAPSSIRRSHGSYGKKTAHKVGAIWIPQRSWNWSRSARESGRQGRDFFLFFHSFLSVRLCICVSDRICLRVSVPTRFCSIFALISPLMWCVVLVVIVSTAWCVGIMFSAEVELRWRLSSIVGGGWDEAGPLVVVSKCRCRSSYRSVCNSYDMRARM